MDTSALAATVVLTGLALAAAPHAECQQAAQAPALSADGFSLGPGSLVPVPANDAQQRQSPNSPDPPTPAELQVRADAVLTNQHRNDDASDAYEYVEHQITRSGGPNPHAVDEKVYRVVPTGTGTLKILLKDNDHAVDSADYRHQLQRWEDVLELMLKPDDPRTRSAYAKSAKKKHDRADMVDSMKRAFIPRWVGRETVNGRLCDVIQLDPNPAFRPHSILQDVLTRVSAEIWVDPDSNQLVRGEAHVTRDLSVGGGILGKLYRGGVFSIEQAEVAPGIWLPTRYQYDFSGRKFLFTFEIHQIIQMAQYRRVGPPNEALGVVKNELASGKPATGDP